MENRHNNVKYLCSKPYRVGRAVWLQARTLITCFWNKFHLQITKPSLQNHTYNSYLSNLDFIFNVQVQFWKAILLFCPANYFIHVIPALKGLKQQDYLRVWGQPGPQSKTLLQWTNKQKILYIFHCICLSIITQLFSGQLVLWLIDSILWLIVLTSISPFYYFEKKIFLVDMEHLKCNLFFLSYERNTCCCRKHGKIERQKYKSSRIEPCLNVGIFL